jgi:hypothetical protein
MKYIYGNLLLVVVMFVSSNVFGQYLPSSYESVLNEISENFATIRGGNSIKDGKNSLRFLSEDKIILRIEHKRKVKTLTFIKKKDEEGSKYWASGNSLTTDTVNKYEKVIKDILDDMLKVSKEKSKD